MRYGGWDGTDWFCIRCGGKLKMVERNDSDSDDYNFDEPVTDDFLCSNDQCFHHNAPLTLHHPFSHTSEAGESYSISWIK